MTSPAKFKKDKEIIAEYETQVKEIRAQLLEQLKCLDQQCDLRTQLLQDLQDFFRKKAEIEMDYSRNLEKLSERFLSKTRGAKDQQFKKEQNVLSPVNCWNLLLTQVKRESRDHATLSDIYLNNIIPRFGQVGEDSGRLFKKSKEIGLQLQEDLMKVLNELYTVMKTYHMYNADSITAQSKLKEAEKQEEKQMSRSVRQDDRQTPRSPDTATSIRLEEKHIRRSSVRKIEKMKEKRQAKYTENKVKAIKARNEYVLALEATNASVFKYYIHDLSDLIDCCDLGYHSSLHRALRTFLSAEFNLQHSKQEGLEALENATENLDASADKQRLMESSNSVFCPPVRFEFQPHMGDTFSQLCAQQPLQGELTQRSQQLQCRLSTLQIENEEVKKTMEATLQTIQDMVTVEDFDVSDCFQYSNSMESVKSTVSETYMSKPSIAKRRANQQETEQFYFTKMKEFLEGRNLITKLKAKNDMLQKSLGELPSSLGVTPSTTCCWLPVSHCTRVAMRGALHAGAEINRPAIEGHKTDCSLASGRRMSALRKQDSKQPIPLVVESCIRFLSRHGLQHEGIFRVSGSQVEVNDIKNAFERGEDPLEEDQNDHDLDSVAGVLKLYFRGLSIPLFPKEIFHDLLGCVSMENIHERASHIRRVLLSLPSPTIVLMRYLFAFLNHESSHSEPISVEDSALDIAAELHSTEDGSHSNSTGYSSRRITSAGSEDPPSERSSPRSEPEQSIESLHAEKIMARATLSCPTGSHVADIYLANINKQRKRPESGSIRRTFRQSDSLSSSDTSEPASPGGAVRPTSQPVMSQNFSREAPDRCSISGHGTVTSISRHSSLKNRVDSPQIRKAMAAGRSKSFNNHRPLDPEAIAQDIEATMNSALNELRELERQSSVKHAPDVVLDTLEPLKTSPVAAPNSEPSSPLHAQSLHDVEPGFQRSSSSASDIPCSFRTAKSVRLPPSRPPATRPKPSLFPKSGPQNPSSVGSSSGQQPPDKSCPV
uniref:SLIT-ROBO Rho GTPase activating protein 2 n=1 Tax=Leptobrachium leishanense TaxID=445787 RepID=A0A8C5MNS4_9ANUR